MMMVLATICCRFETWGFVKKLNFCSDFEHKVWSRFEVEAQARFDAGVWSVFFCWCFVKVMLNQSWILVEIVKLGLVKILNFKFYREAHVWLRIWRWCLVEILKMKFDQDLCLNSWYELNPRVRCAFGNVFKFIPFFEYLTSWLPFSTYLYLNFCLFICRVPWQS